MYKNKKLFIIICLILALYNFIIAQTNIVVDIQSDTEINDYKKLLKNITIKYNDLTSTQTETDCRMLSIEIELSDKLMNEEELDKLSNSLKLFPNLKYVNLILNNHIKDKQIFVYNLKKINSTIKGVSQEIKISLQSNNIEEIINIIEENQLSLYLDAILHPQADKKGIETIQTKTPSLTIWLEVDTSKGVFKGIMNSNPYLDKKEIYFIKGDISKDEIAILNKLFPLLRKNFMDKRDTIELETEGGGAEIVQVFYDKTAVNPIILYQNLNPGQISIPIRKDYYKKAVLRNLITGEEKEININKSLEYFSCELEQSSYLIKLFTRKKSKKESFEIAVKGNFELSGDEIISRSRVWTASQKRLLKSYKAEMAVNYRLKVGNLNEDFELAIKGPVFVRRDEPFDWVQKEFYINGIKWKSKKTPKIPLLQPEKVNIVPLDISLTEEFNYKRGKDSLINKEECYTINVYPKKIIKDKSTFKGKLWIRKKDFACIKRDLTQINLKGQILSNREIQFSYPIKKDNKIYLTTHIKGYQSFSISGTVVNVQKEINLTNIEPNKENFLKEKELMLKSKYRMVRDTDKGMRYLKKNSKGERVVEEKSSKSQTSLIGGTLYDKSYDFPLPIAGVNYLNFDLWGKGKQLNVFFGGVVLLANYSDPAFLNSKFDFGVNIAGFAIPGRNLLYKNNEIQKEQTIKDLPFKAYINLGLPIGNSVKISNLIYGEYHSFSKHKDTDDNFILPQSSMTYGNIVKIDASIKGLDMALWFNAGKRNNWDYWGLPNNEEYKDNQDSFFRWRFILSKDFYLPNFKKFKLKATYLDGKNLDRYSAYKFGFFNEIRMQGYSASSVRAKKAILLNLAYGYKLGETFGVELKYDSAIISNDFESHKNKYFSGVGITGTTALPIWDNTLVRFEVGVPVVRHGIKGFVFYLMFLKMF